MNALTAIGRYKARIAQSADDVLAAQILRHHAFIGGVGVDADEFDDRCTHVLVEAAESGELMCCFRMLPFPSGTDIHGSYSAKHYELDALRSYKYPMAELGRFCVDPDQNDPDILRVAWGAMAQFVTENRIKMLFGCSTFSGTETQNHLDAFALLKARHIGPQKWLPNVKSADVFRFTAGSFREPDHKLALKEMPPLLRTYLMMGGWVSDHAVVDRKLNTLHVFTGLEVNAIPQNRARLLRRLAG